MYLPYANLVNFTSEPQFGTMSESRLTQRVLLWVGEAQDIIDSSYWFTATYHYSPMGIAIDASILVQRLENGTWVTLGTFSPEGTPLSTIISTTTCEAPCTPSPIVSEPLHYYVEDYYEEEYYV